MRGPEALRGARGIADRRPTYDHPIAFGAGTALTITRNDDEWPDFHWCNTDDGREGWVLRSAFALEGGHSLQALPARALAIGEYDARELSLGLGERLLAGDDQGGWRWCYSTRGEAGWVRNGDLIDIEETPRFVLRPIQMTDDAVVADIIRTVMPEFGADGPGFAIHDAEVDGMSRAYARPGAAYFVVEIGGKVLGGGGIAPLEGVEGTCELRKMYFLPALRGLGAGTALIARCLHAARRFGYHQCYLETLAGMDAAQALYGRAGFRPIPTPLGATGHFSCDRFQLREL